MCFLPSGKPGRGARGGKPHAAFDMGERLDRASEGKGDLRWVGLRYVQLMCDAC
jgi:hypothetical protein